MYAVFKTGGKQYRAATGDVIKVEKIEAEKGATVELDQVLMVGEGDDVVIQVDDHEYLLPFGAIEKARVQPRFDGGDTMGEA